MSTRVQAFVSRAETIIGLHADVTLRNMRQQADLAASLFPSLEEWHNELRDGSLTKSRENWATQSKDDLFTEAKRYVNPTRSASKADLVEIIAVGEWQGWTAKGEDGEAKSLHAWYSDAREAQESLESMVKKLDAWPDKLRDILQDQDKEASEVIAKLARDAHPMHALAYLVESKGNALMRANELRTLIGPTLRSIESGTPLEKVVETAIQRCTQLTTFAIPQNFRCDMRGVQEAERLKAGNDLLHTMRGFLPANLLNMLGL